MTEPRRPGLSMVTAADADPLAALYDAHAAALYRYALALTGAAADAEDAVQEVFLRVARAGRLRCHEDRIRAYLLTATRNVVTEQHRRWRRGERLRQALAAVNPDAAPDPLEGLLHTAALQQAFGALPPEQREVLVLKIYEGLTFREISATIGGSINTLASRYRYAIDKLRQVLEDDHDER